MVEQEGNLLFRVGRDDATDAVEILLIHQHQHVEIVVVGLRYLTGGVLCARNAVGLEGALSQGVDGVAEFLAAGSGRVDFELVGHSCPHHKVAHHELSGDAAADISMTDE